MALFLKKRGMSHPHPSDDAVDKEDVGPRTRQDGTHWQLCACVVLEGVC